MQSATDIVQEDLDLLCRMLAEELKRLAGKQLLITGGAGFLGYYLVQTAMHFNQSASAADEPEASMAEVQDGVTEEAPGDGAEAAENAAAAASSDAEAKS